MSKPPFLSLPDGARAYRLRTARGEFAVHEAGRARYGTALLVPGFTGSKEDFVALLAPLAAEGFRVVAVDGSGQYETGGPRDERRYAQRELARDVRALGAALAAGAGGRVPHLLGHSLGGLVARAAVLAAEESARDDGARGPAPFASLTLMSSGPSAVSTGQQERLKMLLGALPVMGMEDIWRAMRELDPVEAADELTPPDVAEFLHRRWMANVPEQLVATARQLLDEPDRTARLAAVPLPVHVLSGEVDYAWPVPVQDAMAERLGAAARTVVAGSGHSPGAERPAETARALAAFWRAHPGPGADA